MKMNDFSKNGFEKKNMFVILRCHLNPCIGIASFTTVYAWHLHRLTYRIYKFIITHMWTVYGLSFIIFLSCCIMFCNVFILFYHTLSCFCHVLSGFTMFLPCFTMFLSCLGLCWIIFNECKQSYAQKNRLL